MLQKKSVYFYLRILLFAIYLVNGFVVIHSNSLTGDEMNYFSYGKRMLRGQPQKIYPYEDGAAMPISGLNALPRAVQQVLNPDLRKTDGGFSDVINGRHITLLLCLFIGIFIFKWARELFGERAAIFSLFLFVFCPNLNANTTLLSTDAYSALFTLTTAYYFRRFVIYSGWRNFILFSIHLALAQLAKQSLVLLPLIFTVIAFVVLLNRGTLLKRIRINLVRLALLIFIVLFIINLGFLFNGTGRSLSEYEFRSDFFRRFQEWGAFSKLPLPLPVPLIEGLDLVKNMLQMGSGHNEVSTRSYLFGNYFTGNGPWYYYPSIILFKTPLSVLILFFTVVVITIKGLARKENFFHTAYPITVALCFVLFFMFFNTSQHSIRHLVMIYPLIYVALGRVMTLNLFRKKYLLLLLVLYGLITFYYYFPNLISYTNELVLPKKNAYRILASTNIDYGQCKECFTRYLEKHQDVRVPGEKPEAGTFLIGINYYLDLEGNGKYSWLQQFSPYAHVNHCLLLIRVTAHDLAEKKLN